MILSENDIVRSNEYNNKSLYVITSKGVLREMPIPLRVRSKADLDTIPIKTWLQIEEVLMTVDGSFAYVIKGKPYPHSLFEIILRIE